MILLLAKFCQHAACRFRMQEGYVEVLGSFPRRFVDKAQALAFAFGQGVAYSVFDAEGYVVYAVVALVKPFLDSALGRRRLKQFKLHLAAFEKGGLDFLVCDLFYCVTLKAIPKCSIREIFILLHFRNIGGKDTHIFSMCK